ncbi:equi merozoite antigen 3 [Theileria equi strain WA]|uniref:Equi merozoite antigen 3 n=1 Tax=Theileria equi strain WA TaxID=1537102 RepID=L0AYB4_THEEQ|nr:equi merozoite antigen 3 [Theileria equi strain WA]AFZ80577.1 equi merozoite antigen 3 [Theileria equi strain WA]|eukprot:XP_004830243.1 equi merozoite antigen 3 [Theileria equi strain WA]
MMTKSLFGVAAFTYFAISSVFAEEAAKPKFTGLVLDVNKEIIDHVAVESTGIDDQIATVFAAHRDFAIEKVVDGEKIIKTFDLSKQTPERVEKHVKGDKIFVVITVDPALRLAFKKEGDAWVEMPLADFYEELVFKGLSGVAVDLDKFADGSLFSAAEFGSGNKHTFSAAGKRASKVTFGEKDLLDGNNEVILDVFVFVSGDKKVAKVVYLYKGDGRIKEIFFQLVDKAWTRVEVKAAATVLHSIDSSFPADYKTVFDGFSAYGVFSAVAAVFAVALFC